MAAEAAEAKLTEALRSELEKTEKDCIRPLQVSQLNKYVDLSPATLTAWF